MKKPGAFLVLILSITLPLSAQSNQVLDQLLGQPEARFGDVVYMTLTAVKLLPDTATPEEALQALRQQGWKVRILPAEAPVPLGDYAFLLMKAFKLRGGIMYSLFPGPRYACREMRFLGMITADARPNRMVSGEETVRILGNVMARKVGAS